MFRKSLRTRRGRDWITNWRRVSFDRVQPRILIACENMRCSHIVTIVILIAANRYRVTQNKYRSVSTKRRSYVVSVQGMTLRTRIVWINILPPINHSRWQPSIRRVVNLLYAIIQLRCFHVFWRLWAHRSKLEKNVFFFSKNIRKFNSQLCSQNRNYKKNRSYNKKYILKKIDELL